MERSEPSLVPEWLRSTGGSIGVVSSSHHLASSQADGPVLALPKRNRSSKNTGSSDASHSSLLERSHSSNSRRGSCSNGSTKHDRGSYSRSYSSFNRSQRDRDRERLTADDNWDMEYSDPLRRMMSGRSEDNLGHSLSMTSRRQGEVSQRKVSTELRNGSRNNHGNGNGTPAGSSVTGIQKVSFERDFPLLVTDERPKTPDVIRVSSPGLSRGIQSLSIGNSPLVGGEGWTSALAEVPLGVGSKENGPSPALQPLPAASSVCHSISGAGTTLAGLNMAEALVQVPARSNNTPQPSAQLQREELAFAQSKKLIPMTPVLPKTSVNSSDKLKPKIAVRSSDAPKNGAQQLSPLQLGGQSNRGTSARVEGPKSPSGKLLLLKPGRESGVSTKDVQSQTTNVNNRVANGQPSGVSLVAADPLKNHSNPKLSSGERKVSGFGLNLAHVADKRNLKSRSDFFNLMRKKSMNQTSGSTASTATVSSDMVDYSDNELKELPCAEGTTTETGGQVIFNGETCIAAESFSQPEDNDASVCPNEEERAFLRSLGWDENAGDDEALTEEEINAFYQEVWNLRAGSKVCRGLWPKIMSHFEVHAACPGAAATEPSASASE